MRKRVLVIALGLLLSAVTLATGQILVVTPTPTPGPDVVIPLPPEPPPHVHPVPPPIVPPPQVLPHLGVALLEHRVTASIEEGLATTEIHQVWANGPSANVEADYIFPVPPDAALDRFTLEMNGEPVAAEVLPAEEARRIYVDIVRRIRDPGLLEHLGQGLLRVRAFPFAPNEHRTITLRYRAILEREGGLYRIDLPLGNASVQPSVTPPPVPGNDHRRRPANPTIVPARRSATIDITHGTPLAAIWSPTHAIEVLRNGPNAARISYEAGSGEASDTLRLYYGSTEERIGLSVLGDREPGRERGHFLLLLAPGGAAFDAPAPPRDLAFVFDTSGSMAGRKMDQARAALNRALDGLRPEDRFAIVLFASGPRAFRPDLVPASKENIAAGLAFVDRAEAAGATDIDGALQAALSLRGIDPARPFTICFLTDGIPTSGLTTDPLRIRARLQETAPPEIRLFVFGVGNDVNSRLLDRIAADHRGARTYVTEQEDIERPVEALLARLAHPVLTDLRIEVEGATITDIYPAPLPDLYRGDRVAVLGRFEGSGAFEVRLHGRIGGEPHTTTATCTPDFAHESLGRLWAVRRVGHLLDRLREGETDPGVTEEVVALGRRYGILTPYTSFLVVEDGAAPGGRPLPRAPQGFAPEDAPAAAGADALDAFGGFAREPEAERLRKDRAKAAIQESEVLRGMKEADQAERNHHTDRLRPIAGKTFRRQGDVWVDTDYDPARHTTPERVTFLSDRHLELVGSNPRVAKWLALGSRVLLVLEGKAVEVVP